MNRAPQTHCGGGDPHTHTCTQGGTLSLRPHTPTHRAEGEGEDPVFNGGDGATLAPLHSPTE